MTIIGLLMPLQCTRVRARARRVPFPENALSSSEEEKPTPGFFHMPELSFYRLNAPDNATRNDWA